MLDIIASYFGFGMWRPYRPGRVGSVPSNRSAVAMGELSPLASSLSTTLIHSAFSSASYFACFLWPPPFEERRSSTSKLWRKSAMKPRIHELSHASPSSPSCPTLIPASLVQLLVQHRTHSTARTAGAAPHAQPPTRHCIPSQLRNTTTTNDYTHQLATPPVLHPKRRACSQRLHDTSDTRRGAARRTPYTAAWAAAAPTPPPGTWTVLSTVRPRRRRKIPCVDHSPSRACAGRGCRPRSRPRSRPCAAAQRRSAGTSFTCRN